MDELYEAYAKLIAEKRALEKRIAELKRVVMDTMVDSGVTKVETDAGKILLERRVYPKYSALANERLNKLVAELESAGEIVYVIENCVVVRSRKEVVDRE